jgi:hypothetical protein
MCACWRTCMLRQRESVCVTVIRERDMHRGKAEWGIRTLFDTHAISHTVTHAHSLCPFLHSMLYALSVLLALSHTHTYSHCARRLSLCVYSLSRTHSLSLFFFYCGVCWLPFSWVRITVTV